MKKIGKLAAMVASATLALTMGAMALTGCGAAKDFVFEAEDAVLTDPATVAEANTMTVQTGPEWTGTEEEGAEVTVVGYFSTAGQTITWNINASKDCDATLLIRGSSCAFDMTSMDFTNWTMTINELAAADSGVTLKVNDAEVAFTGTLPGTEGGSFTTLHFGDYTANIHLKKGDNKIVLESVTGGFNVDKITVNSKAELTFNKTDNSDRPASHS